MTTTFRRLFRIIKRSPGFQATNGIRVNEVFPIISSAPQPGYPTVRWFSRANVSDAGIRALVYDGDDISFFLTRSDTHVNVTVIFLDNVFHRTGVLLVRTPSVPFWEARRWKVVPARKERGNTVVCKEEASANTRQCVFSQTARKHKFYKNQRDSGNRYDAPPTFPQTPLEVPTFSRDLQWRRDTRPGGASKSVIAYDLSTCRT